MAQAEILLLMLKNAESNAKLQGLDEDSPVTEHIQVDKVPTLSHCTNRADGRTNPYTNSPATLR